MITQAEGFSLPYKHDSIRLDETMDKDNQLKDQVTIVREAVNTGVAIVK